MRLEKHFTKFYKNKKPQQKRINNRALISNFVSESFFLLQAT